jgi:hypothetical protein
MNKMNKMNKMQMPKLVIEDWTDMLKLSSKC